MPFVDDVYSNRFLSGTSHIRTRGLTVDWSIAGTTGNLSRMERNILALTLACLLTVACSGNGFADTQPPAAGTPAALAIEAVSKSTGVAAEQLTVTSSVATDFSDSSLGCPQPDMAYLQVITPGHKVMIDYNGQAYDVRVAGGRAVICETQRR